MTNIAETLERNGYVVFDQILVHDICESLKKRACDLVKNYKDKGNRTIFSTLSHKHDKDKYFLESSDKLHFFWEEEAFDKLGSLGYDKMKAINKIGHGLHLHDKIFSEFSEMSLLSDLIKKSSYFAEPQIAQSMYIFKQAKIGGEVLCHQDSTFIHSKPNKVLALWFALEDANEDNGCLWGIPGSYTGEAHQLFSLEGGSCSFEPKVGFDYPLGEAVPLPVKKGSVIMFHGLFPHFSYPNRSDQSRQAFTLHYVDRKNSYLKSNWNQSKRLLN